MTDPIKLIVSFLGGGILVALINWARTSRSERATRKHEFLKNQIAKVYGPIYFFAGLTEALFALNEKFHKAYDEHFIKTEWSKDPHTRENLRKDIDSTLQTANHYVRIVRENNTKIMAILRNNYAYIDEEDTEIFQKFIIDHLRMEHEFKKDKPLGIPFEIYEKVGEISYSRKEFLHLAKKKFVEKTKELKNTH